MLNFLRSKFFKFFIKKENKFFFIKNKKLGILIFLSWINSIKHVNFEKFIYTCNRFTVNKNNYLKIEKIEFFYIF